MLPAHPLAEVFGFPAGNLSPEAERHRASRLCPYNNRVPNCTKDKADDPLGVCSVFDGDRVAITCPVRFRQGWTVVQDAADFFFPEGTNWTSLTEVRLNDKHGRSAGNIDIVLVSYDTKGRVLDFGALEIQAVYISGNVRRPFDHYMEDRPARAEMNWTSESNYPRPDYLSSSRKRLAPQLLFKGEILNAWDKKIAVALDQRFFDTLPAMSHVDRASAEIAWIVYDLEPQEQENRYLLSRKNTVYTTFAQSLTRITRPDIGDPADFLQLVQTKLLEKLNSTAPDTQTIDFSF